MIKRASTILLTLFLLLTSANILAQTPTWADPAGKTNYKVNGATSLNEVNILNTLYESSSTSCSFNISTSGLKITTTKGENKFKYTFSGVATNATDKKCTVTIKLGTTNVKYRIVTINSSGNEDYSMSYDYHGGGTKVITTYAKGSSASIRIDFDEDGKTMVIEEISIKCQILPTIIVPAVFMGEEATFTAAGLQDPVTWYYQKEGETTWKEIGTGQSIITSSIKDNGIIKAIDATGNEYTQDVYVTIRCKGTLTPDFKETFKINVDKGLITDIVATGLNGSSRFTTNYNPYTGGDNPGAADEEEYMIVKSTDNTFPGWEVGNNSNGRPLRGHSDDGFMIINCNTNSIKDGEDKFIFKLDIGGLCTYTRYNFSAYIMNVCQETKDTEPVNVLFRVYGIDDNGNQSPTPLLNLPTGDMGNPDENWYPHKGSVYTAKYQKVRLLLYNNNTDAVLSGGKVVGNDVGLDDIEFSRCTPEIGVYTEDVTTVSNPKNTIKKCNDGSETVDLYVGNPEYSLNHFMPTAYYVLQEKRGSGNWTTITVNGNEIVSNSDGYAKYTLTIENGQEDTQYRAIVASKEQAARDLITKTVPDDPDCVSYYKMANNFATVTMECANPCTKPAAPTVKAKLETCPGATYDLNNLLLNKDPQLTYIWYDQNDVALPAPNNIVSIANPGETTYKVKSEGNLAANICPSDPSSVTVKVINNPKIELLIPDADGNLVDYGLNEDTYYICSGASVTIQTNIDATLTVDWETDPSDATVNAMKTANITVSPQVKTKYTASVLGGSCYQPSSMYIDVVTVEKPTIKTDDDNVCKGSEINITSNYSDNTVTATAQYEYKWYRTQDKTNWGEPYKTGVNSLEQLTVNEVGTWYYKLVVSVGGCSEESDPLEIKVGEAVEFTVSATDYALCLEDNTYINIDGLDQTDPDLGTFQWFEGDTPVGAEDEASVNVTPTTTGTKTYTAVVKTVSGCQSKKSLDITVDPKVNLTVSPDQDICVKELSEPITASGADSYEWTPNLGTNGRVSHEEPGEKKYTVKAIAGECDATAVVTINVHELPEISSITPKSEEETNDMVITMNYSKGQSPFEFSLDGVDFIEVQSGIWENAPIGWNVLYVKDEYECINFKEFYVEPTPISPDKFFSPNGDNNHDEWKVRNLESYDSYIVEIFTRHGKRLYIKRVGSFNTDGSNVDGSEFTGWNGEYNGKPMPSDDYWYLITVEDIRKQYTGHFTLKR